MNAVGEPQRGQRTGLSADSSREVEPDQEIVIHHLKVMSITPWPDP